MDSTSLKRCEHYRNKLERTRPLKAPKSRLAKRLLKLSEWFYSPRHRLSSNDSRTVSQKPSTAAERKSRLASNDGETVNPVQGLGATGTSTTVETAQTPEISSNTAASSTGLIASNDIAKSDEAKDSETVEAAGSEKSSKSAQSPSEVVQAHRITSFEHTSCETEPEASRFSDSGNESTPSKRGIRRRFSLPGRKFSLRRRKVSGGRHSLKPESNVNISNVITISRNGQPLERLSDDYLGNPKSFEGPVEMSPPWANVKAVSSQQRPTPGLRPPSSIYSQEDTTHQNSPKSPQKGVGHERRSRPMALYLASSPTSQTNKAMGPSTPQNKGKVIDASVESPEDSGYGGSEPSSSPNDRFQNGDSLKRLEGRASPLGDEGRAWLSWTQSDAYRSEILEAEFNQQRDKIKQRLKTLSQDMKSRSGASLEMFRRHEEVLGKCYNNSKVKVSTRSLRVLQMATRNITKVPEKHTANPPIIAIQTPLPTAPRLTLNWPEHSPLIPLECLGEAVEEDGRSKPWWEKQKKPRPTDHVAYARKMMKKSKPGDVVPVLVSDAYGDMVECSKSKNLRLQALSDETPPPHSPRLSALVQPSSSPRAATPRRQLTFKEPSKVAVATAETAPPRAFSYPVPQKPKPILAKKRSSEQSNPSDRDPEFVDRVQSLQLEQLVELVEKNNSTSRSEVAGPEQQRDEQETSQSPASPPTSTPAERRTSVPPIRGMYTVKARDSLQPTALKPSQSESRLSSESRTLEVGTRTVELRSVAPRWIADNPNLLRSASKANSCYTRDLRASWADELRRRKDAWRIMKVLRASVVMGDVDGGKEGEGEGMGWL